jgi:hypothetical protein
VSELDSFFAFFSRDRRPLMLGLGAILVVTALARGYPAWRDWDRAAIGEAERSRRDAARLTAVVQSSPAARDSVAARTVRLARLRGSVLTAASSADASAALIAHVASLVDDSKVRVLSMSLRSSSPRSTGRIRVAVRVSVLSGIEELVELLRAIEGAPLMLAIRELSVESVESAEVTRESPREDLRADLVLEALAMVGESPIGYAHTAAPR